MEQNTIAIIWDFDKTLVKHYMQAPLFRRYGVDEKQFWREVNALEAKYAQMGVRVNSDTIYLNHMLTCVQQGLFPNLTNELLFELGAELEFYPGAIEILRELKEVTLADARYRKYGIHVENYIISTGIAQIIRGSEVFGLVDGIWACEFIQDVIYSELAPPPKVSDSSSVILQLGYIIDNTSKTRAIFEINKGVNVFDYMDVNSRIDKDARRIPFENMIYIADGPSDVPVFSVLKQNGGKTFAVYPKGDAAAFDQVNNLSRDGRVDMLSEADYSPKTPTHMWLTSETKRIADSIYKKLEEKGKAATGSVPTHLN